MNRQNLRCERPIIKFGPINGQGTANDGGNSPLQKKIIIIIIIIKYEKFETNFFFLSFGILLNIPCGINKIKNKFHVLK